MLFAQLVQIPDLRSNMFLKQCPFERPKQTSLQRRPTDGQQEHEKMFNIADY